MPRDEIELHYDEDINTAEAVESTEDPKEVKSREKYAKLVDELDKDLLLKNIEDEVNSKMFDIAEKNFKALWEDFYVPSEVVDEFLNKIKEVWKELLLANELTNEQLKSIFWEDVSALKKYNIFQWNIKYFIQLYYIKKLCPDNFVATMDSMIPIFMWFADHVCLNSTLLNAKLKSSKEAYDLFYSFVEKYWSESAKMIDYFIAHDWTYLREWAALINDAQKAMNSQNSDDWGRSISVRWLEDNQDDQKHKIDPQQENNETMWSAFQFFESFIFEPEWVNLYEYLKDTPIKLSNLWWKVINEIDLRIDKWINFCFHWILSMVKSRSDINFPLYKDNMSENEKRDWKQQWDRIIKEYENVLRNYISQDFSINEKWEKVEKPRNKTFDKVFYLSSHWDRVIDRYHISTDVVQWLTSESISDYSYIKTGNKDKDKIAAYDKWSEFINELRVYLKEHPNDKVLVCVNEHWDPDWSSANEWSKDDWLQLANMSSNINIWSIRCFFWTAFEQDNITNNLSSVSWYSNNSPTFAPVTKIIDEAAKLDLWYHEMEIYTRLKYLTSVSPLTDNLSYTDWNTWETQIWKIWLAQNDGPTNVDWADFA